MEAQQKQLAALQDVSALLLARLRLQARLHLLHPLRLAQLADSAGGSERAQQVCESPED